MYRAASWGSTLALEPGRRPGRLVGQM